MSKNIPFIHNYCDRWCERCYFTASCAVFESERNDTEEEKDINNKAFWDKLSQTFSDTIKMIKDNARQNGIDLDTIPSEEIEAIEHAREKIRRMVKEHPLILLSNEYSKAAGLVLNNEALWKQKADEMVQQDQMGTISREELEDHLHLIKECKEVIGWYQHFILIKFSRALSSKRHSLEAKNDIQTDCNGSAKIALIAVHRSQEAWTHLFSLIPDEDKILPLLSLLTKIEKMGKEEFPRANEFIRPGFDEVGSYSHAMFNR